MKNKNNFKANLGGPSIILIILVLALSIFALLALRSSTDEKKLAKRTAESATVYYAENGRAEEIFAMVEDIMATYGTDNCVKMIEDIPEVGEVVTDADTGFVTEVDYFVGSDDQGGAGIDVVLQWNGKEYVPVRWKVTAPEPDEGFELELLD